MSFQNIPHLNFCMGCSLKKNTTPPKAEYLFLMLEEKQRHVKNVKFQSCVRMCVCTKLGLNKITNLVVGRDSANISPANNFIEKVQE